MRGEVHRNVNREILFCFSSFFLFYIYSLFSGFLCSSSLLVDLLELHMPNLFFFPSLSNFTCMSMTFFALPFGIRFALYTVGGACFFFFSEIS